MASRWPASPRSCGRRAGAADAAGDAYRAAGDTDAARESWQQALAIPGDLRYSQASQVRARPRNLAKTS
jgi:predicted negative regulator of RcsB-dependent stress response